jgi:hypothetical protein
MCTSLVFEWPSNVIVYSVFKILLIGIWCPINMNILAPKIGSSQMYLPNRNVVTVFQKISTTIFIKSL